MKKTSTFQAAAAVCGTSSTDRYGNLNLITVVEFQVFCSHDETPVLHTGTRYQVAGKGQNY